ncbi:MAG: DDE-type integrase/transposase/recombinase [Gammaproteobacteria bacterium]
MKRIFPKMLKRQGRSPRLMVTDKLKSHAAARREVMPSTVHCQDRYANNRAEASHRHTPPTREADEAIQITRTSATIPVCSQPSPQPISRRPSSFKGMSLPPVP